MLTQCLLGISGSLVVPISLVELADCNLALLNLFSIYMLSGVWLRL